MLSQTLCAALLAAAPPATAAAPAPTSSSASSAAPAPTPSSASSAAPAQTPSSASSAVSPQTPAVAAPAATPTAATPSPAAQVVPYVQTKDKVLRAMVELAAVAPGDTVLDLGCGDGRLVLAAVAPVATARGTGIEIDPAIVAEAREKVRSAGLEERVKILEQDIFTSDLRPSSVVMMYLLFTVNLRLRPKLMRELAPGTRVVSNTFSMGDAWPPDETRVIEVERKHKVYKWVVPAAVGGDWTVTTDLATIGRLDLHLSQVFQQVKGEARLGERTLPVAAHVEGKRFSLSLDTSPAGGPGVLELAGTAEGTAIDGTAKLAVADAASARPFHAQRQTAEVAGVWTWQQAESTAPLELVVKREADGFHATLRRDGRETAIADFYVWGASVLFSLGDVERGVPSDTFSAVVSGDRLLGTHKTQHGAAAPWEAMRAKAARQAARPG